jgi:aryl-alcohol dehydrogenase-like predicted oxidoreductase
MNYKLLGKSGLRVSEFALGTMTFGNDWGWGAPKDEAQKVYNAFRESGGNFVDTANIGEFMKDTVIAWFSARNTPTPLQEWIRTRRVITARA